MDDYSLQGLLAAMTSIGIGGMVFLHVLNRQLKYVDLGRGQVFRTLFAFIMLIIGSMGIALFNIIFPGSWLRIFLFMSIPVWLVIILGEVRLILQRRKYQGTLAVERKSLEFDGKEFVTANPNIPLLSPLTTTDLQIYRYEVDCSKSDAVSKAGVVLKIVLISDFHLNRNISFKYYLSVIERCNEENPDLVFIPGDFVTHLEDAPYIPDLLGGLKSRLGVFTSLGNHDYWAGAEDISIQVINAGVSLLRNDCIKINHPMYGSSIQLTICGCDDPWGKPNWNPPVFQKDEIVFVLSHTPDNIYRLVNYPITAVFSGHCHGGQFRMPGFGSFILPSEYGRRFDHGHFEFMRKVDQAKTHLFVSAGVGAANPPIRLYCQPDIFVVNFNVNSKSKFSLG